MLANARYNNVVNLLQAIFEKGGDLGSSNVPITVTVKTQVVFTCE
jgi:hypothetical protein